MVSRATIWKRRAILMAAIGAFVAIPVTIAVRGGDDEAAGGGERSGPPAVGQVEFNRGLGIELRLPDGWKRKRKKGVVAFRSNDDSVLVAVSAPGPAKDADQIQADALAAIAGQYRKVKPVGQAKRTRKGRLGGRPAQTVALTAKHPKSKADLRILVATAKGKKRSYLVEVFTSNPASLVEAQTLLNNLKLTG